VEHYQEVDSLHRAKAQAQDSTINDLKVVNNELRSINKIQKDFIDQVKPPKKPNRLMWFLGGLVVGYITSESINN